MRAWLIALLLSFCAWAHAAERAAAPNVAAASDLQFALPRIAAAFEARTGQHVTLLFGSSGNLKRQIDAGAPIELFLSAEEAFVDDLRRTGRAEGAAPLYGVGRLALFSATASPVGVDASLDDVRRALADGRLRKFAIANPEHAPYGRAARESLQHLGLWSALEPRLVLGENVSQAAQFVSTGAAQAGLVAYSLVRAPAVAQTGRYVLVPAEWHEPLRQRMTLIAGAGPVARAFFAFLQEAAARAILREYGFALPGE
jgi:molybdate transport system substrate-binding protein